MVFETFEKYIFRIYVCGNLILYEGSMYFTKMNGLGNDFIIINAVTQNIHLTPERIRYLSDRHCGIGFDQLLVLDPAYDTNVDFSCRIYNANGTQANQCGNGVRCLAQFVYVKKLIDKKDIKISTSNCNVVLSIQDDNCISVNMGHPIFDPERIPFYVSQYQKMYVLFLPIQTILCSVVSMGNPHCVILVETIESASVSLLGSMLGKHHAFPEGVNVSFMQIINRNNIRLRVYERGVGETQACGSAACAAVVVGIQQELLCSAVAVSLPGGTLFIDWKGIGHSVYMTGSAVYVYDGYMNI